MAGSTNWWDAFGDGEDVYGNPWSGTTGSPLANLIQPGMKTNLSPDYLDLGLKKGGNAIASLLQPQPGQNWADASSLFGAFSSGEKANRALEGQLTQGYDRLNLEAQDARNRNESDALHKLNQTSYIAGGGSQFKPPTLSINGKTYNSPDLGFGPKPSSPEQIAGAKALQSQLQPRLSGQDVVRPTSPDYLKPGVGEKIGNYGALATGGIGSVMNMIKGGAGAAGTIAGLLGAGGGFAAPAGAGTAAGVGGAAAGAGGGGLMGSLGAFATNPWTIGIAGALGGGLLLKKLLSNGPNAQELAGRGAEASARDTLASGATPQQLAEAQQAVQSGAWKNPQDALALIRVRDQLISQGMDPQSAIAQSNQLVGNLFNSTKGGTNAVNSAYSPIASMMGRK